VMALRRLLRKRLRAASLRKTLILLFHEKRIFLP
jgi:hypothetical protein